MTALHTKLRQYIALRRALGTRLEEPAATLDRLEYVLVILDYRGGLPPPEEQPTNCEPEPGDSGTIPDGEQPCIEATPTPAPSSTAAPSAAAP